MPITMEELTRRVHAATPFIGMLGVDIVSAGGGAACVRLPLRLELTQDLGHAHGGVVGALADIACNLALRAPSVTIEYKINFLKGAAADSLRADATLLREGRTTAVAEAKIWAEQADAEPVLVAVCLATLTPQRRES
jgi:uncharacterized protein (TIGR00369 family)